MRFASRILHASHRLLEKKCSFAEHRDTHLAPILFCLLRSQPFGAIRRIVHEEVFFWVTLVLPLEGEGCIWVHKMLRLYIALLHWQIGRSPSMHRLIVNMVSPEKKNPGNL
jgi:hypothetical protein